MRLRISIVALLGSISISMLSACAAHKTVGSTEVTSASYSASENAAQSLAEGRDLEALAQADRAIASSPTNAWGHYARASALRGLGHYDAAASEFREAEARFGDGDPWGKSISIYGRARALNDMGRCAEAKTVYGQFAVYVRQSDPNAADMALAYAEDCRVPTTPVGDDAMTKMTTAIITGRDADALALAKGVGPTVRDSGWVDYNRAIALARQSHTDEAVAAYRAAEQRFAQGDPHAQSLAVYGRARALDNAGRCAEATRAYQEYAAMVRASDPKEADLAVNSYARACAKTRD